MTIGASGVADVVVGGIVDNQRRRLSVGRGRRGQQEGETAVEEGVTVAEEGVVGGFSVPRLEDSDIVAATVTAEEGTVVVEQRATYGVDQKSRLEVVDVDGKEKQQWCDQQLLSMLIARMGGTVGATTISGCGISGCDAEQEQGRTRNQQLRTSGNVPFLLEMLTTRREGTVVVGKSGMLRSAASIGETATAMAMAGCDAVDGSKGGCRGSTAAICKGSLSMENHQIQSPYPIAPPHSSTSSSCISNDVGVTEAAAPPTPPPTPKSIPRCMGATPCATTFVQADTSSFKQEVQLLTGSVETTAKRCGGLPPAAKAVTGPKRPAFKLYERRSNLKTIGTLKPTAVSPHRRPPEITSPSVLDFPSLALSPVTPLTPDPFDRHPDSDAGKSADARSIAEKGFYLHPSPRDAEPPRLLPLFPISSPRTSSASAACSST
ncbi:hypothetical protein B296_00030272 [Ensete ventricosum]|uniref:VQ domain-containing protein n=1 Tax=Ensete ventricosum TaxID=4639 RepID=A0A426ZIF6_ENSVE|nr:hypothetical protein B296_00030272 [Ensete ventricosum]